MADLVSVFLPADWTKSSDPIVTITADGRVMRGGESLESLSKEQLIVVVNELIDVIRKR